MMERGANDVDLTCRCYLSNVMPDNTVNYPQINLKECKYRITEIKMSEFIGTKLESDFSSHAE